MLFAVRLSILTFFLFSNVHFYALAETDCSKKLAHYYSTIQDQIKNNSQNLSETFQKVKVLYSNNEDCSADTYYLKINFDYHIHKKNTDSALNYATKILSSSSTEGHLTTDFYFKYSSLLTTVHSIDSAEKYALKALAHYESPKQDSNILATQRLLTYIYLRKGNNSLFKKYYSLAIDRIDTTSSSKELALLYTYNGLKNFEEGNFDIALGFALKALKIFERTKDTEYIIVSYNRIAIIMGEMHLIDDAISYLEKGLDLAVKEKNNHLTGVFCNNIGIAYTEIGDYKSAMSYLQKSLVLFKKENDVLSLISCYEAIGNAYCLENSYDIAIDNYEKGVELAKSIQSIKNLAILYIDLGKVYLEKNKLDLAKKNLTDAYLIASPLNLKDYLMDYYFTMSFIFEKESQFDSAYIYNKQGQLIKDKIEGSDTKNLIKQLKVKFEADLKELENEKLQNALESKKKQNILLILLLIAIGLILTSTSILFIYRYRNKKLQYQTTKLKLDNLKKVISEKNQLISSLEKEAIDSETNLAGQMTEKLLIEQNWLEFMIEFEQLYTNFFSDIKSKHEKLTKNDLRFIALLKLNLNDKEIAHLLNIEHDSVRKTKYRIRNKIDNDPSLLSILNN